MSFDDETEELRLAVEHLLKEADTLEKMEKPILEKAIFELRKQAELLNAQAEKTKRWEEAKSSSKALLVTLEEQGEKLAREIKYRASLLSHMVDTGTIVGVAREWDTLALTLEHYAVEAIKNNFEEALDQEIEAPSKIRVPNKKMVKDNFERSMRQLFISGSSMELISKISGVDKNKARYFYMCMSPADKLLRTVVIRSRVKKTKMKIFELRENGVRYNEIARRTGVSNSYVWNIVNLDY